MIFLKMGDGGLGEVLIGVIIFGLMICIANFFITICIGTKEHPQQNTERTWQEYLAKQAEQNRLAKLAEQARLEQQAALEREKKYRQEYEEYLNKYKNWGGYTPPRSKPITFEEWRLIFKKF